MIEKKIIQASIKADMFLHVKYDETTEDGTDNVNRKRDAPMHQDCREAFWQLVPHLALSCEQISNTKKYKKYLNEGVEEEDEILDQFTVESFELHQDVGGEKITIKGYRRLENGYRLKLESWKIPWDDEKYPYANRLCELMEDLTTEVNEYVKGKRAPVAQTSLEDDDAFAGNDAIEGWNNTVDELEKKGISVSVEAKKEGE